jgi:hypothetical protein
MKKLLTIFSAPKPFTDPHIDLIQRNAIRSWLQMGDAVEIFLLGDEPGITRVASELRVTHIGDVKQNEQGTPLVSSIFSKASDASSSGLLLFTNADMILFPETLQMTLDVQKKSANFIALGQRYDLDVDSPIDFSDGWPERLREKVAAKGRLHSLGGSDYFIFLKGVLKNIPDFAIGRAGWDNWMIYYAISQGWLILDTTPTLMAVHQNHSYAHLPGDRGHQRNPETMRNLELAGGMRKMYSLLDVKFQLVDGQIRSAPWSLPRALHRLEQKLQPDELVGSGPRWWLLRGVRKLRRALQGLARE